jgi:hypothetical protein
MENNMIAQGNWSTFLSLKDEKLLMAIRRHPFVVIMPSIILVILTGMFIGSAYMLFERLFSSFSLFIATSLLLISIAVGIIAKLIIDWYFHIYILTNRKILEFRYTPLTSYVVNDIMLDRVFCTEVDSQTNGFIHDLVDLGDIIVTFDRPTHQEEFVLRDVYRCHMLEQFLTKQLLDGGLKEYVHPLWFPGHNAGRK